jgi:hypothetical protein
VHLYRAYILAEEAQASCVTWRQWQHSCARRWGAEPERHLRSAELGGARAGAVAVATAIRLISVAMGPAHGQVINLGGRGWSAAVDGFVTVICSATSPLIEVGRLTDSQPCGKYQSPACHRHLIA